MSKEYVEKVNALPDAQEMDDVVALFNKITGAYPNAILYGSNIGCKAAQGMTLVAADADKANEMVEKITGKKGTHTKDTLTKVMLIAMCESVCREVGMDVKEFFKDGKRAITQARNLGMGV